MQLKELRSTLPLLIACSLLACKESQNAPADKIAVPSPISEQTQPTTTTQTETPPVETTTHPSTADTTIAIVNTPVTTIKIENQASSATAENIPITFGQVFKKGDVPDGASVAVFNSNTPPYIALSTQVDTKTRYDDGSLRHALISVEAPSLKGNEIKTLSIGTTTNASAVTSVVARPETQASVSITIDSIRYSANINDAFASKNTVVWLSGPEVSEWTTSAPLKTSDNVIHPHLHVIFGLRAYKNSRYSRVETVIENDWSFVPDPKNQVYDITLNACGHTIEKLVLTHYHHARWRKEIWCDAKPALEIQHNTPYLISTGAISNYDSSLHASNATLSALAESWSRDQDNVLGIGLAEKYMPMAGGRGDIGPLPLWTTLYLLNMDSRAKTATMGTAEHAGSWSIHYRDQNTGLPVTLQDYPYMTLLGRATDTRNPATQKYEAFPACAGDCSSPYTADSAHQPSFSFIPYLLTGEYYHLEELQFWANYNMLRGNPGYRDASKGLLKWDQVRGQAWSLRTLADAAVFTPDAHPLKQYFLDRLHSNIDWYNSEYSNNTSTNALGIVTNGPAFSYSNNTGISPWQDDFFTWAVGHVTELGIQEAAPLLEWKSKFVLERMTNPNYCWIFAAAYSLVVRESSSATVYAGFDQVYQKNYPAPEFSVCNSADMATKLGLSISEMTGYATSPIGYPSNLQAALAVATSNDAQKKNSAWQLFINRTKQPDYANTPTFAIIPRQ